MKHLLAFLCALAIVSVGIAGMLMDPAGNRPTPAQPDKPPVPERFEGTSDTLSPEALHLARVRNTPTLAGLREAEEAEREYDRRIDILRARPRSIRLPPGYRWGRCLLVVESETRISGPCAYRMEKDGGFSIEGPRQIYEGIDYPKTSYFAEVMSNDYWAGVYKEDGVWTGHGNGSIDATHASGPEFGPLRRRGACFVGPHARICLWKRSADPGAGKPWRQRSPEPAARPDEAA
jgi:hypothetical protein